MDDETSVLDDIEDKPAKKSQATELVELAESLVLFNCDDEAYVDLHVNDHRETWTLRSKRFRDYLTRRYYLDKKKTPSAQAMEDALRTLSGKACYEGECYQVHTRIGEHCELREHHNVIYLDLCDEHWRAVEISATGWRIVKEPRIRFIRRKGQKPLPEPVPGGNAELLFEYLNLHHDAERRLILAWLVQALRPRGPYPSLILQGEQGTAKTTAARVLIELTDPRVASNRTCPRNEHDLLIAARNGWVVSFDNLSGLPNWLSDALCRLATGGGFSTRELYSDTDEILIDVKRPVVLNGIDDVAHRPDLIDRSIVLTLAPIPDEKRKPESEFWKAFHQDAGDILGGLLDGLVEAIRSEPEIHLERLPRMADFAIWATAAETAFGYQRGDFVKAFDTKRENAIRLSLDGNVVAMALNRFMESRQHWDGTMAALLKELSQAAGEKTTTGKYWPGSPRGLGSALRRLATAFRSVGMDIQIGEQPQRDGVHVAIDNTGFQCSQRSQRSHGNEESTSYGPDCEHVNIGEHVNQPFSNGCIPYHPDLFDVAVTACDGLRLDPRQFLNELQPEDHNEIITDPEQARAYAVSLAGRLS